MNTLDLYIDHLKEDLRVAENYGLDDNWTMDAAAELKRAVDFANERGLTLKHLTPQNRKLREERAGEIAKELWLERNRDSYEWAEMAWAEMTSPDDWSNEALELLDEAYGIMDKEKTDV